MTIMMRKSRAEHAWNVPFSALPFLLFSAPPKPPTMDAIKRLADQLQDSFPAIDRDAIREFERELPASLPDDYAAFLVMRNGGVLRNGWQCDLKEPGEFIDTCAPKAFLAINADEDNDLRSVRASYSDRFPGEFLPIVGDSDVVVMCLTGDGRGKVYVWDSQADTSRNAAPGANMYLVRESFTDFCTALDRPSNWEEYLTEETPLFRAVESSDVPTVQKYLDAGGQLEVYNNRCQRTLLGVAASFSSLDIMELLLKHGANLEARDKHGKTPLRCAFDSASLDGFRMLVKAGADINARDDQGVSVREAAVRDSYYKRRFLEIISASENK